MVYDFYAFLSRMKYIKRWSLMRSVVEENIMEHTFMVTTVAHCLALIRKNIYGGEIDLYKVLTYAQYHETGEVITGDLPTPIKYFNSDITTAYKDLERGASEKLINKLPQELREDYRSAIFPDKESIEAKLVKCADKICALIKCMEELRAGNKEFKKAKESILKEVSSYDLPECKYFIANVLPSFEKTLDELQ